MTPQTALQTIEPSALVIAGQVANHYAANGVFADFVARKSANTRSRYKSDLKVFADYLHAAGVEVDAGWLDADGVCILYSSPEDWRGVTWGLVAGFVQWQLNEGFAIGTINGRLSTVKVFASLAAKAGTLPTNELVLIRGVQRYKPTEGANVDEGRPVVRVGNKKATNTKLTKADVDKLLSLCDDTPQGRRDKVLCLLFLRLGLRVGEVAALNVQAVDLSAKTLTFYREKVHLTQVHELKNGLLEALTAYFANDVVDTDAPLIRKSSKSGALSTAGMTRFGLAQRIADLGDAAGIAHLSPHDLRHYWATQAAKKTPLHALMSAGGWASPAMPLRYIDAAVIANDGVVLDD